jgi:multidrug efflux pump subunit AcrA (membrane-fusion protein)
VAAVYPQAEVRDNVVNYVAVVTFDPPRGRTLRPEMTATVRVALATRADVLALPRRAVRREDGRTFVVGADGARRFVTVGSRDETHVEIVDGLREGDAAVLPASAPAGDGR